MWWTQTPRQPRGSAPSEPDVRGSCGAACGRRGHGQGDPERQNRFQFVHFQFQHSNGRFAEESVCWFAARPLTPVED